MDESASNDGLNNQYIALERLYSERRWAEVEADAALLLGAADGEVASKTNGSLRARVLLLLGHTRLYGFNDAAGAAEHYRQVLASEPEALLLGIAQEGLNQCLAADEPTPTDAMPWLEKIAPAEVAAFMQPVETPESPDNNESPTEIMEIPDQPTQLSPKESIALAQGLLRVVIRPN